MPIQILFENEDIVVIDKPSGIVIHPYDYSTEYTLTDFLQEKYPEIFFIENNIKLQDTRIIQLGGIVHKLDRDTSGVLVIAKRKTIFDELRSQFKNHTIKKTYEALVEGIVTEDFFTINAPLGRNKKEYKQSVNPTNPRGELREAITNVEVISRNNNTTFVRLSPKTGRTHQLRAHMAFIGHPIIGDKAYGSTLNSLRILLHAKELCFTINNKDFIFEAEIPNDFKINNSF